MNISKLSPRVKQIWLSRKLPLLCKGFTSDREVIFIGGCGRSGTTLLRSMIGAHSEIIGGPELNIHINLFSAFSKYPFLPKVSFLLFDEGILSETAEKFHLSREEIIRIRATSKCFADFLDKFFGLLLVRSGRRRVVEKTPKNATILPFLFSSFPNSKFIHVIRDGRDVVCSLRNHPRFILKNGEMVPSGKIKSISQCTERWVGDVSAAREFRKDPRYLEVFYEKLVEDPERELKKICEFLGIEFSPKMLEKRSATEGDQKYSKVSSNAFLEVENSRIGRWKKDLSENEAEAFEKRAGYLLRELRYEKDASWLLYYPRQLTTNPQAFSRRRRTWSDSPGTGQEKR